MTAPLGVTHIRNFNGRRKQI